jgi:hypothetical protein
MTLGIGYMRAQAVILGVISLDLFAVLLGGATALLPIYARDILKVGPTGPGLLRSATAGGTADRFDSRHVPPRRNTGLTMFAGVALFGIATIIFGLPHNSPLSQAALLVLGASDMVSVYVLGTVIQLATPDAMRGRISALNPRFSEASIRLGWVRVGRRGRLTWDGALGRNGRARDNRGGGDLDVAFPQPAPCRQDVGGDALRGIENLPRRVESS